MGQSNSKSPGYSLRRASTQLQRLSIPNSLRRKVWSEPSRSKPKGLKDQSPLSSLIGKIESYKPPVQPMICQLSIPELRLFVLDHLPLSDLRNIGLTCKHMFRKVHRYIDDHEAFLQQDVFFSMSTVSKKFDSEITYNSQAAAKKYLKIRDEIYRMDHRFQVFELERHVEDHLLARLRKIELEPESVPPTNMVEFLTYAIRGMRKQVFWTTIETFLRTGQEAYIEMATQVYKASWRKLQDDPLYQRKIQKLLGVLDDMASGKTSALEFRRQLVVV
ncbi:hypothetical protein NEOLI_000409 [Neolecta irregularis DAH-3]|uniref:F-box domain-containing protein n=1 Tax=Neolecta irregularis (strain DAH-3) TaxID=1198029 RepID=A0A1U7LX08_NEOID|nr:hypothetical protein NEOLI_000409 [Neolecta irregularis DAH-3]|eukprot:OLL27113.1 hypothetical protein NEOLI_000409 [Neolecta irregularis DAH-3]